MSAWEGLSLVRDQDCGSAGLETASREAFDGGSRHGSTRRLRSSTPAASVFCSRNESFARMARNNQSSRAARIALNAFLAAAVRDRTVCLPSVGSGEPLTSPADTSVATVAPIDCGRIPSARARVVTVAGPSRSRRERTEICGSVKSPAATSSRSFLLSLPTRTRSSPATA
jgi:hypothetical protein